MKGVRGQTKAIKEHLEAGHTLTNKEAVDLFGCYRLSARIKELRGAGMDIRTVMMEGETRYGTPTRYGKYMLAK